MQEAMQEAAQEALQRNSLLHAAFWAVARLNLSTRCCRR
tara:strand:- start:25 stop:141 length:117 start_codon:yes stop_codon:yes gene_type:complete